MILPANGSISVSMDAQNAAKCLAELGNETRLSVFRLLVRAGPDGMVVGDIQRRLEIPASTLSHHLAHLSWAGLIEQNREGRNLRCRARHDVMHALVGFLTDECCIGFTDNRTDESAA